MRPGGSTCAPDRILTGSANCTRRAGWPVQEEKRKGVSQTSQCLFYCSPLTPARDRPLPSPCSWDRPAGRASALRLKKWASQEVSAPLPPSRPLSPPPDCLGPIPVDRRLPSSFVPPSPDHFVSSISPLALICPERCWPAGASAPNDTHHEGEVAAGPAGLTQSSPPRLPARTTAVRWGGRRTATPPSPTLLSAALPHPRPSLRPLWRTEGRDWRERGEEMLSATSPDAVSP